MSYSRVLDDVPLFLGPEIAFAAAVADHPEFDFRVVRCMESLPTNEEYCKAAGIVPSDRKEVTKNAMQRYDAMLEAEERAEKKASDEAAINAAKQPAAPKKETAEGGESSAPEGEGEGEGFLSFPHVDDPPPTSSSSTNKNSDTELPRKVFVCEESALAPVELCREDGSDGDPCVLHLNLLDATQQSLSAAFPAASSFIEKQFAASSSPSSTSPLTASASKVRAVYVHCAAGVSRSASITLGYLMSKRGMRLEAAFKHLSARRPQIAPNDGFLQQLQELEVSLFGGVTSFDNEAHAYRVVQAVMGGAASEEKVKRAIRLANGNVNRSVELLLEGREL